MILKQHCYQTYTGLIFSVHIFLCIPCGFSLLFFFFFLILLLKGNPILAVVSWYSVVTNDFNHLII